MWTVQNADQHRSPAHFKHIPLFLLIINPGLVFYYPVCLLEHDLFTWSKISARVTKAWISWKVPNPDVEHKYNPNKFLQTSALWTMCPKFCCLLSPTMVQKKFGVRLKDTKTNLFSFSCCKFFSLSGWLWNTNCFIAQISQGEALPNAGSQTYRHCTGS